MTRILTGVNVPDSIGWIFQSIFIIWSIFDCVLVARHWNRYKQIPNKATVEKMYFYFIVLCIIGELLRVIDPFSMHNIYPFYVNRINQIFFGTVIATSFGIISGDTYHTILYRINEELRPSYFRYCTIISIAIVVLPALCSIFVILTVGITMNNIDLADISIKIAFGCNIFGLAIIGILFLSDVKKLKAPSSEADAGGVEEEISRQQEIIIHAKQRMVRGLMSQNGNICFSILAISLELIDGGYAINGYYFLSGLLYGTALRMVPTITLYTQWIAIDNKKGNNDDDDDGNTLTLGVARQTTTGFLREIAEGVDLKRMSTRKAVEHMVQESNDNM